MTYITARPKQIEIRSHWFQLLMYMVLAVLCGTACWYATTIRDSTYGETFIWISWIGVAFCVVGFFVLAWQLMHAGEVMIRLSPEEVWIKGGKNGTTIPWQLVDSIVRPTGKQKQFLVLQMTDENYQKLERSTLYSAMFHINKTLGIRGIPLNISGSSVSHEMFESWVRGYWSDWKERHVDLGKKGN